MLLSIVHTLLLILLAIIAGSIFPRSLRLAAFGVSAMTALCYLSLLFGVLGMMSVGFSLTLSTAILAMTDFVLLGFIYKLKGRAGLYDLLSFDISVREISALILIITVCLVCSFKLFGYPVALNYETSDPAVHFGDALRLASGGVCTGQFLSRLGSAMFMASLAPFMCIEAMPQLYVYSDMIFFVISAICFYAAVRTYSEKTSLLFSAVLTVAYCLGYPLNNLLFGYSYLGTGVTLISSAYLYLKLTVDFYRKSGSLKSLRVCLCAIALSLSLVGLVCSYSLFVPAVFFSIFLTIALILIQGKAKVRDIIASEFFVFAGPVLFGFFVVYIALFGNPSSGSSSVGGSIVIEGYIYRDLYSSFLLIAPMAITGFVLGLRRQEGRFILPLGTVVFALFSLVLFILGIGGFVSSYYFYKCHFVLWLFFYLNCSALISAAVYELRIFAYANLGIIFSLGLIVFSGADSLLSSKRPLFNPSASGSSFMQIYNFNFSRFNERRLPQDKYAEFQHIGSYGGEGQRRSDVYFIGPDVDAYWFRALNSYDYADFFWHLDSNGLFDQVNSYDYIYVEKAESPLTTTDGMGLSLLIEIVSEECHPVYTGKYGTLYERTQNVGF